MRLPPRTQRPLKVERCFSPRPQRSGPPCCASARTMRSLMVSENQGCVNLGTARAPNCPDSGRRVTGLTQAAHRASGDALITLASPQQFGLGSKSQSLAWLSPRECTPQAERTAQQSGEWQGGSDAWSMVTRRRHAHLPVDSTVLASSSGALLKSCLCGIIDRDAREANQMQSLSLRGEPASVQGWTEADGKG